MELLALFRCLMSILIVFLSGLESLLKHKVIMEYYPTLKRVNTILIASENLPAKVWLCFRTVRKENCFHLSGCSTKLVHFRKKAQLIQCHLHWISFTKVVFSSDMSLKSLKWFQNRSIGQNHVKNRPLSESVRYVYYVWLCQFCFGSLPRSCKTQCHWKTWFTCQRTEKCSFINQQVLLLVLQLYYYFCIKFGFKAG